MADLTLDRKPAKGNSRRRLRTDVLVILRMIELARYWPEDSELHRLEGLYPNHAKIARSAQPFLFAGNENERDVLDGADCRSCRATLVDPRCADRYDHTDHTAEECAEDHLKRCEDCKQLACPRCHYGCTCPAKAGRFLNRIRISIEGRMETMQ